MSPNRSHLEKGRGGDRMLIMARASAWKGSSNLLQN